MNPFTLLGQIESEEDFFPRPRIIRGIFEILKAGASVALVAKSGAGKSSLLMEVQRQAKTSVGRTPLYIDMSMVSFLGCKKCDSRCEENFRDWLSDVLGCHSDTLSGVLRQAAKKEAKYLLLMDEFEAVAWLPLGCHYLLRAYGQGSDSLFKYVVASHSSLDEFLLCDDGNTSPLANIFCEMQIADGWPEEDCRSYIFQRIEKVEMPSIFSEEDVCALVKESGGHPRKLARLCFQKFREKEEDLENVTS